MLRALKTLRRKGRRAEQTRRCLMEAMEGRTLMTASFASSVNVAMVGGPNVINGGTLPTSGADLAGINFTTVSYQTLASNGSAALAGFDTVVLNVATSSYVNGTYRSGVGQLQGPAGPALVDFVGTGHKLIIYDSEMSQQNYSWLPYTFTTNNPGAMGAPGTLTDVEENTLSSLNSANPLYINCAAISTGTDAVGDANVMTSMDPNWHVDLSATNYYHVTGPAHVYSEFSNNGGIDNGLMIYNGLDMDYLGYSGTGASMLRKLYVQELKQQFNPSGLPATVSVVGINISPTTATVPLNQTHTVTATLKDLLNNPKPGVAVAFKVNSGPNAGLTGSGISDANGQATFTYPGSVEGVDKIVASFVNTSGTTVYSTEATAKWVVPSVDTRVSLTTTQRGYNRQTGKWYAVVKVQNNSSTAINGPIQLVMSNLTAGVTWTNPTGTTADGKQYLRLDTMLSDGKLDPGEAVSAVLYFSDPSMIAFSYNLNVRGM